MPNLELESDGKHRLAQDACALHRMHVNICCLIRPQLGGSRILLLAVLRLVLEMIFFSLFETIGHYKMVDGLDGVSFAPLVHKTGRFGTRAVKL